MLHLSFLNVTFTFFNCIIYRFYCWDAILVEPSSTSTRRTSYVRTRITKLKNPRLGLVTIIDEYNKKKKKTGKKNKIVFHAKRENGFLVLGTRRRRNASPGSAAATVSARLSRPSARPARVHPAPGRLKINFPESYAGLPTKL